MHRQLSVEAANTAWHLVARNECSSKYFKHGKWFSDDYVLILCVNTYDWEEFIYLCCI